MMLTYKWMLRASAYMGVSYVVECFCLDAQLETQQFRQVPETAGLNILNVDGSYQCRQAARTFRSYAISTHRDARITAVC